MSLWINLRVKNYHYFTLCSNEFVFFLVALAGGESEEEKKVKTKNGLEMKFSRLPIS